MPIHDWTRVSAGTWHDFHLSWVSELMKAFNTEILPDNYYSTAYYDTSLRSAEEIESEDFVYEDEVIAGVYSRRTLSICRECDDRVVALIEVMSPGNKSSDQFFRTFVDKTVRTLGLGQNLLIVDLFPVSPRDPNGIHGAIWEEMESNAFRQPLSTPLTLVSYDASPKIQAYVDPTAVSRKLEPMPLFLRSEWNVQVPLEETYLAAYHGMPRKYKAVLEA